MKIYVKKIAASAMMAAIVFVLTMISVPVPMNGGYINLGDVMVLISGVFLGTVYGAVAAGIGAALADIVLSYAVYAPATFVIKALIAVIASLVYILLKDKMHRIGAYVISIIVAEPFMVLGYFVYEFFILGYGTGAVAGIISNSVQGISCAVISVVLYSVLKKYSVAERIFGTTVKRYI